ncbi:DNA-3-methyladenine glycosylase [Candidatus Gracilibacteria bacterium]|nr:DNA-3-methyladenine glycosylase [Candidatus Gracilibacteria bacterium]
MKLTKTFFQNKPTLTLAQDLLGKVITYKSPAGVISGIINETEIYIQTDEASHTFGGKITKKNKTMFEEGGHLYVYFTYGMYYCMNIVSEKSGFGSGVLIRSVIPYKGEDLMIKNRNYTKKNLKDLSNGPAKVTMSFGIDKNFDGINLLSKDSNIYLEDIDYKPEKILTSPRIGISKAKEKLWRFYFLK